MKKTIKPVLLVLGGTIVVVLLCSLIIYLIFPAPGYVTAAKSVQEKIKLSIGEEQLRSWAMNVLDKYRDQAERT